MAAIEVVFSGVAGTWRPTHRDMDAGNPLGAVVVVFVWFPSLLLGILSLFWLPRFLLPQWIKDDIKEIRRGDDLLSQALKPGGSLHGRLGVPPEEWPENQEYGPDGEPRNVIRRED